MTARIRLMFAAGEIDFLQDARTPRPDHKIDSDAPDGDVRRWPLRSHQGRGQPTPGPSWGFPMVAISAPSFLPHADHPSVKISREGARVSLVCGGLQQSNGTLEGQRAPGRLPLRRREPKHAYRIALEELPRAVRWLSHHHNQIWLSTNGHSTGSWLECLCSPPMSQRS